MANRVYVAISGESGQGYSILGVFNERFSAVHRCQSTQARFGTGGWKHEGGMSDRWTNGCDYMEVLECWIDPC